MRSQCLALMFLVACGSSHEAVDAGAVPDGPSPDGQVLLPLGQLMPQDVAGDSAAVMATPTVVAITYDSDTSRTDIEAFFPEYAASPAWAMETAEYGIGALTVGTPRHLTGTAATTDAMIQAILTANVTGTTPAWGAPSENTVYSFFLPAGTVFDDGTGSKCCIDYDGYHDDFIAGGVDVAYAIQCTCGTDFPPTGITPLQELTTAAAHETVEAVTDPRFENDYAWGDVDAAHEVWTYVTDGELADLCEFADTAYWTDAPGMTYAIQRIWSNAAARAGTDPCVGAPAASYYQAVPEQPDNISIAPFGDIIGSKGKRIAMGATGTVTLQVAGTAGSGPFNVTAMDVASEYFGVSPSLTITQPTGTYKIGDTVTLQVTVVAKDDGLGGIGAESFEVETAPVGGGATTYFWGLIGQ